MTLLQVHVLNFCSQAGAEWGLVSGGWSLGVVLKVITWTLVLGLCTSLSVVMWGISGTGFCQQELLYTLPAAVHGDLHPSCSSACRSFKLCTSVGPSLRCFCQVFRQVFRRLKFGEGRAVLVLILLKLITSLWVVLEKSKKGTHICVCACKYMCTCVCVCMYMCTCVWRPELDLWHAFLGQPPTHYHLTARQSQGESIVHWLGQSPQNPDTSENL